MVEKPKGKQVEHNLRLHLSQGHKITHNQALLLWKTNRLAEYVRRLRVAGMDIKTEMVSENGDVFGVYYIAK